jgi:hypothetical protein
VIAFSMQAPSCWCIPRWCIQCPMITGADMAKVANVAGSDAGYGELGRHGSARIQALPQIFRIEIAVSATIQHNFGLIS